MKESFVGSGPADGSALVGADGPPPRESEQPIAVQPPLRCPTHLLRLIGKVENVHGAVRAHVPEAFPCAQRNNIVFQALLLSQKTPQDASMSSSQAENSTEVVDVHACDALEFMVCPHDGCGFAICQRHVVMSRTDRAIATLLRLVYIGKRRGAVALLGLVGIVLAQALYLPAVRTAAAAVICSSELFCEYPTCYDPPTADYLVLVLFSGFVLIFIGIGVVAFFFAITYRRKRMVVHSRAVDPSRLTFPGKVAHNERPLTFVGIALCGLPTPDWQYLGVLDSSVFKGVYRQYHFASMMVHGVLMVFKAVLVVVILGGGEPDSLQQLALVGGVELAQEVFFTVLTPFLHPWIDAVAKVGFLHQVLTVALLFFHRANVAEDPTATWLTWVMIGVSATYVLLVIAIVVGVVVIPWCSMLRRRHLRERKLEEKQRAQAHAGAEEDTEGGPADLSLSESGNESDAFGGDDLRVSVHVDDDDRL